MTKHNLNNKEIPILYTKEEECCGCAACYSICSVKAIYMENDFKGFLYPMIKEEICIRCHKCIKVCPLKK